MIKICSKSYYILIAGLFSVLSAAASPAQEIVQGPPAVPVRIARVEEGTVSDRISLVGTAEAIAESTVAAEVPGIVDSFPVKEGGFFQKGDLLVELRSIELKIRLKAAIAESEKIRANLQNAEKELKRYSRLKETDSIAARKYDEVFYAHRALQQEFLRSQAEIDRLEYQIKQKKVRAPFSGFVAKEHTEVGEWITAGGAIVTLIDLSEIKITVDVPERYVVAISPRDKVEVLIRSVSSDPFSGHVYELLPQGNPDSRTFPVRISLPNPGYIIKSGMEALVTFKLPGRKNALLVPKDAVVAAGEKRMVFTVADGKAMPVNINVLGYHNGHAAFEGNLKPGDPVVIRGNERLRPGQDVDVLNNKSTLPEEN